MPQIAESAVEDELTRERLARLRVAMTARGSEALLTADPIHLFYATGVRNMTIFSMMGPSRFALIPLEGPVIVWEFAGAEHLASSSPVVDEVRTAPGITAVSGPGYALACADFAAEIMRTVPGDRLWVERLEHPMVDALREAGATVESATDVFVESRLRKGPLEITAMREGMSRVVEAVDVMRVHLEPGRSEVEVWSHFHQHLIARGGEYVSTRLAQAGERTFPYFQEAGRNLINSGDLFCIDTDAIGLGGYAVDFSRTYLCGSEPTATQRTLHRRAHEQLHHNAALLAPGVSFEDFANAAWPVPEAHAPYGYYCLAHGLGLSGEFPYIPVRGGDARPLDGQFEPGMVMCIESYIGDSDSHTGVKLEDQFLITADGAERMSDVPFDPHLLGA